MCFAIGSWHLGCWQHTSLESSVKKFRSHFILILFFYSQAKAQLPLDGVDQSAMLQAATSHTTVPGASPGMAHTADLLSPVFQVANSMQYVWEMVALI